jgi:transcriptional regulator GlxA family with amidase domain
MEPLGYWVDSGIGDQGLADVRNIVIDLPRPFDRVRRGGLGQRSLERSLLFMELHLGEPISLSEIAAAACLSRAHFARMFRISTGISVMTYLMRLRIGHAKAQLRDGETNLAAIACALGFCDQSHFCRVFRREVGVTPGHYAREEAARQHARSSLPPASFLGSISGLA